MKITYIIFLITYLVLQSFGDEDSNGSKISSSYAYRIEYDDSDHGKFGHKIEVKDGNSKVNIRSENAKKYNTAVATKTGKPYLPQKRPVIFEKPKEDVSYLAIQSSTIAPILKNTQQYSAPQVHPQPQNNPAIDSALQKYSRDQLAILLSQNKNPFLPLDPKDSINKFISKYVTPQQNYPQSAPQSQHVANQYQTQSYASIESLGSKSQYPETYTYSPLVQQQNSHVQQSYNQPQIQQSFTPPTSHENTHQTSSYPQSVPATQGAVQYVYVPQSSQQTSSQPISPAHSSVQAESYRYATTGSAQIGQQTYQPVTTKQQYVPSSSIYQSAQFDNSIPKSVNYPAYNHPVQTNTYANSLSSGNASPIHQSTEQVKQQFQYVTGPSSGFQTSPVVYNNNPKASTQVSQSQPNYQNVYENSIASHYPSTVSSSQYGSNIATNKPAIQNTLQLNQGNFDFSKYVPTQNQAPTVAYKQSEARVQPISNTDHYFSGPTSQDASHFSQGKFDFSRFSQYIPTKAQASPVTYKHSEVGSQSASNNYFSGPISQGETYLSQGNLDLSKFAGYQASSVSNKPSEAGVQSTSNTGHYFSGPTSQGETHLSQGQFDFSKYPQYVPSNNQPLFVAQKPSEGQSTPSTGQYYSGLLPSKNANYAVGTALPDSSKINLFGSNNNAGHNLFAGLQSPNFGSLFSGISRTTGQDASKYLSSHSSPQPVASAYGNNVGTNPYSQFANQANPSNHYKPVVENSAPNNNIQLQYQSPNVNPVNYDVSKFQSYGGNVASNGQNFNLNQISNVQASDNKYGQYAIDIKQGTNSNGAAQVMVQTNYNLGAHNVQPSNVPAASDNNNVKYEYVPSYSPTSPEGANHGK